MCINRSNFIGLYIYLQFNIQQFYVLPTQCMCFVWISEQTAIISVYRFNWQVFITETECLLRGTDWIFKSGKFQALTLPGRWGLTF